MLTFEGINDVYTYLSPDIEYFHGRHLISYIIMAINDIHNDCCNGSFTTVTA